MTSLARVVGPLYFVQCRFTGRKWKTPFDGEIYTEHRSLASAQKEADALQDMLMRTKVK